MKLKVYTDGFNGFVKRGRERAKAITAGLPFPPSRGITFESPAEMVRLLTPARLDLFDAVKKQTVSIRDLAAKLGRDVSAVRRDVSAGEIRHRPVAARGESRSRAGTRRFRPGKGLDFGRALSRKTGRQAV